MLFHIQLLTLDHCWGISTGSCLTTLLTVLILLHATTTCLIYPKNWLGSQRFNDNEELMEGVKTWLSSQAVDFFGTVTKRLIL
jgi:hypothetical protein